MTKITNPVWLLAILCLALGCRNEVKLPNRVASNSTNTHKTKDSVPIGASKNLNNFTDVYAQAAIETCNCIQPMVEKAILLKKFEENNQLTDMKAVAREMAQIQPQIQKCSDEIRQKFNQINNNIDEKRVRDALLTQCPNIGALFSNLNLSKIAHD